MTHEVFISYSSKDKAMSDAVCAVLESRRIRCWIAPRDVPPGMPYGEALLSAIHDSKVLVLVFSTFSNESSQVIREVERAVSAGIPILPFRIENVLPTKAMEYFISSHHWLDAMTPPVEAHLIRLADSVGAFVSGVSAKPVNPTPDGPSFARVAEEPQILVGTRVGHWQLEEFLGQGGSGFVYRAKNIGLGSQAAVKVIRYAPAGFDVVARALSRGVRGLAALSHPNVISVFETGKFELAGDRSCYLVMDLVRGQPLDEWSRSIDGEAAFSARLTCAIAMARALEAAHTCRFLDESGFEMTGILHGDIKPANVLVSTEGRPVILDFMIDDIQRLVELQGPLTSSANPTRAFGTQGFMSHEQADAGVVTTRSDIYGLGVTYCYLFAPKGQCPPLDFFSAAVPEKLLNLVRAMTKTSPDDRPQAVSEVVLSLSSIAGEVNLKKKEKVGIFTRLAKAIRG